MRVLIVLGTCWLSVAAAQELEKPALQNTGKPMLLECHCEDADIQAAGLSCTIEDPCPLFLELDWVEAVGNRIFLAGNIHSATATLFSMLLASDDSGKTWREAHERMRAAALDHIQFIDFENGWVSGEMQQPLPRDPFMLVTADGGKSWRARPVFGDPQFGSILQFVFSSRTNGSMVLDRGTAGESGRYELYETPDAGETWMLRQTNQRPMQIKHAAVAPNGDWRIRAEGASKSYRIERRGGGGWRNVAAFTVAIGMCKPAEAPAAPPDVVAPGSATSPQKSQQPGR